MHGILPTVESGKPVEKQVKGLLAFAEALHHKQRADAKFRARRWSSRSRPNKEEQVDSPRLPDSQTETDFGQALHAGEGAETLERIRGLDDSSDGEEAVRKKGTARNLPRINPSTRACRSLQLADSPKGPEDLEISKAEVLVEKYRQRTRAAEAAVQASVERFHRGRRLQEPLLDDLKTLKKVVADKNRHAQWLESLQLGLGIRQNFLTGKQPSKASPWEEGNTRGSSRSSERTSVQDRSLISKKSGEERGLSFITRSKDVDAWSLRTNSKDSTQGRRQANDSPELSPEEEEEWLMQMWQDLQSKELAQAQRLQRSAEGPQPVVADQKADWLHGLHSAHDSNGNHESTLQVPRYRLQRAPRCLQPLSKKDLAARRIGNVVFWHSTWWPSSLRPSLSPGVAREVPRHLEETLHPGKQHTFVVGQYKQGVREEAQTIRLDEAEPPSSSSSSSSSSIAPKEKLAKSCLKPWRSPVEAYLGKSFIFPQRRGSARASELLGSSLQKSNSLSLEKTPSATAAVVHEEAEATSRAAWEKIKRTNGFAALCK